MHSITRAAIPALLLSGGFLSAQTVGPANQSHGDPFTPVGSLTVTPTVVQPGVQPNMVWNIRYPESVSDLAVLDSEDSTTLSEQTDVKIRITGASLESEGEDLPVAVWVQVGTGSSWELIFYGDSNSVVPDELVYQAKNVSSGTTIEIAAAGKNPDGSWNSAIITGYVTDNVSGHVNGSTISEHFDTDTTESFMTQYLDESDQVVLGPHDIIHCFELESQDPADSSFDLQDVVVVTTLGKTNNGHGNNVDGVDSSNPGNAWFMDLDTDPTVDDEGSGGGALPSKIDDKGKINKGKKNA